MHPASRIFLYILAALVIPGLSFLLVSILLFLGLMAVLSAGRAPLALVWRTRWLLLVLALAYGYSLPGEAVWPFIGVWSPSLPGMQEGLERVIRLITLLLWLDWLVLPLPIEHLLSGLYALSNPLHLPGCDVRRIALRLALTLKAIEAMEGAWQAQQPASGKLLRLFDPRIEYRLPEKISLVRTAFAPRDIGIPLLLVVAWLIAEVSA